MDATLLHHPGSGNGSWSRERLLAMLSDAGIDAHYVEVEDAPLPPLRGTVVVAGGDGTVKKAALAVRGAAAELAILPIGGGNNIARSLDVFDTPEALLRGLAAASRRQFFTGAVLGGAEPQRFVEAVGLGAIAEAAQQGAADETSSEKRRRGRMQLHRALLEAEPVGAAVFGDGARLSEPALIVEILNMPTIHANLPLAPQTDPGDDRLALAWLPATRRQAMLDWLANDDCQGPPPLCCREVREAVLEGIDGLPLRLDDRTQPAPAARLVLRVDPAPVTYLVPRIGPRICPP